VDDAQEKAGKAFDVHDVPKVRTKMNLRFINHMIRG
jgi:hypothetical protein